MATANSKTPAPKKVTAKPAKAGAVETKAKAKEAVTKKAAPAAKKTPASRQPAANKAPVVKHVVSDEQRYRMIAEAAYFRAESRQFKSDPVRDWIEAERDIAILFGEDK